MRPMRYMNLYLIDAASLHGEELPLHPFRSAYFKFPYKLTPSLSSAGHYLVGEVTEFFLTFSQWVRTTLMGRTSRQKQSQPLSNRTIIT